MRPGVRRWSRRIEAAARELGLDPKTVLADVAAAAGCIWPSSEDVAAAAKMPPDEQMAMIRGMVEKLQARMDADGGDVEGWLRLAQSRMVLGEAGRAEETFGRRSSCTRTSRRCSRATRPC